MAWQLWKVLGQWGGRLVRSHRRRGLSALSGDGDARLEGERELRARLVRIVLADVRQRASSTPVGRLELDDIAHRAADDAVIAILAQLGEFRRESRSTTWTCRSPGRA